MHAGGAAGPRQPGYIPDRTISGGTATFETFLLINSVAGLEPGLYRYLALSHSLQLVAFDPVIAHTITDVCFGKQFILQSGVALLCTAVPNRVT